MAEIEEQLAYREANREAVAAFHTTRILGRSPRLVLDEDAKKFMVTSAADLVKANPDVLDFSQVAGCRLDIHENRSELRQKDEKGHSVSYDPPRYEYSYYFYIDIAVNHPYFDQIRYSLSSSSVKTGELRMRDTADIQQILADFGSPEADKYREYLKLGMEIRSVLDAMRLSLPIPAPVTDAPPAEPVTCPFCGASTIPDENGRCEYCGSSVIA